MSKEVIDYIENRIKNGSPAEVEFDMTLLSLYKRGLVNIEMTDGEPLIQISEKGTDTYMQELALSFSDMGEA